MKNIEGFTLTELIAVIALMGMLSVLVLPSVNRAVADNKKKTCSYYEDSMVEAAKLYIYKESADIIESNGGVFPTSGMYITLEELIDNYYMEEYNDTKTTISDAKVYVSASKPVNSLANDLSYTYTYKKYFKCMTDKGKVIYTDNGV